MKLVPPPFLFRNFFLACLVIFNVTYQAQVSGTALLTGLTNAGGIKVKFTANSGGAVTDSCMTDVAGHYSLTITPGVYKIAYSKFGFHYVYNNASAQVLTNTSILPAITMEKGHATFISGNVSGAWSDTSVYYLTGDMVVANNTTLTIPPGTKIKSLGFYKIISDGVLKAIGSFTNRITFTLQDSAIYWDKLDLNNDACVLHYCTVEYLMTGIVIHENSEVSDCIVRKIVGDGISVYSGRAKIVNNEIYDFKRYGIWSSTTASLICNNIHHDRYQSPNEYSAGIKSYDSTFVLNNNMHHLYTGIRAQHNSTIRNNFIHDNFYGIYCTILAFPYEGTQIVNNTFSDNTNMAMWYDGANSTSTKFINNIVVNSLYGVKNITGTCENNLVYNCGVSFNTVAAVGIGQLVAKNANGDSIDSYFNVFLDPKFTSSKPFLQQSSPALNAGNSAYNANIGADASLICYQNIITGIAVYAEKQEQISLFPNPNNGIFTLRLKNKALISIYNLQGKEILANFYDMGEQTLDVSFYEPGLYFVRIKEANKTYSLKFIKE
ncbi:hypothetical protein CNR22_17995 [Sphingobacteriaceae bacterium]|nr:hypothetical protein CNR22_17995 [Sphingobacteriaceae bacterium]